MHIHQTLFFLFITEKEEVDLVTSAPQVTVSDDQALLYMGVAALIVIVALLITGIRLCVQYQDKDAETDVSDSEDEVA